MEISRKYIFIIVLCILVISFACNILTFKNGHDWGGDFAAYILHARSIVDGTMEQLVDTERYLLANSTFSIGGIIGPWGFPLMVAPVYHVFGLNMYAMKVMVFLFYSLSLIVLFFLFKDRLGRLQNVFLVTIFAFNTWFFSFKDHMLSDIPYLFFSLLTIFLMQRFILLRKIWINEIVSCALIGLLIFISCNLRSIGFVLIPTLLAVQFFGSRSSEGNKYLFILDRFNYIPHIVFVALSLLISSTTSVLPDSAYSGYFGVLFNKDLSKLIPDIAYLALLPSRFFAFLHLKMNAYGFHYNTHSLIAYGIMLCIVIWGMVSNIKRDYIYLLYVLFSLPIVLLFSHRQGFRLIIPIFPFFVYYLFSGLSRAALSIGWPDKKRPFKIKADIVFGVALVLISLFYFSRASLQNIEHNNAGQVIEGPYTADSVALFEYVKKHTEKDDSVIFFKPRVLMLYTDRKSLALRKDFTIELMSDVPAEYYVHDKRSTLLNVTVQDIRGSFDAAYENDTYILFQLENEIEKQNIKLEPGQLS